MSDETQVIEESSELMPVPATEKKANKGKGLAAVAAGAAAGIGAIAYDAHAEEIERLTAPSDSDSNPQATPADSTAVDSHAQPDSVAPQSHPSTAPSANVQPDVQLLPDHVHVLNASENMSFSDAFDWARETAGPGQLFEWNGNLYHTCNPQEFAALPQDMKDVFETLWLANAAEEGSVIGSLEDEVVYNIDVDDKTNDLWITEDMDGVPGTDAVPTEAVAQTEPVSMDSENYGIAYTEEDFDNDFDGTDEWVNPDDVA